MKRYYLTLLFKIAIFSILLNSICFHSFSYAENPLLMEISSENLYDGSIKVLFILSEVNNPKMFFYKGESPKVVCDFANVTIKPGLKKDIRVNKRFIKNVRMGEHNHPTRKVRVVLDLVPGKKYIVREIPPEPNIFSVIIRSEKEDQAGDHSNAIETSLNEQIQGNQSTHQDMHVHKTTTTTSPPTTIAMAPDELFENEYEEDKSDMEEENFDDDATSQTAFQDQSWHKRLLQAAEGQEPPYKWPIEKSFGNLKMIVHLDTDSNGFLTLKGYFINMTDDFFYQIQLNFDLFNDNADVVEQAYGEFFNVEPGERRKMNIPVAVKTVSNFHLMNRLFW